MREGIGRESAPVMVQLALWPSLSRGTAWAFFWFSSILTVVSIIYGFQDSRFFLGGLFVFSSLWYLAAIQWMDKNRAW